LWYDLLQLMAPPALESSMFFFFVVALVAAGFWMIFAYNGLIALKNQTSNALKQIDVQLKRRHDLIPNLVQAVQGAMDFEKDTLAAVISARNTAVVAAAGLDPQHVADSAKAESQLSGALGRLMAVVEAYPDLKATGNVQQLQEELTSTENKVSFARQLLQRHRDRHTHQAAAVPDQLRRGYGRRLTGRTVGAWTPPNAPYRTSLVPELGGRGSAPPVNSSTTGVNGGSPAGSSRLPVLSPGWARRGFWLAYNQRGRAGRVPAHSRGVGSCSVCGLGVIVNVRRTGADKVWSAGARLLEQAGPKPERRSRT
jgi:LemA protein